MRYAILADIHANIEAFDAVLAALKDKPIDQYKILGDVINYGANPHEALSRSLNLTHDILMGNHEYALFDPNLATCFNPVAQVALRWTQGQLTEEEKKNIRDFPLIKEEEHCLLVHGTPVNPEEFYYLFTQDEAEAMFTSFEKQVCFVGHTHIPALYVQGAKEGQYLRPGKHLLKRGRKCIVNVGSVGQPRDFDWRAAVMVFDDTDFSVELLRVEYDWQSAARKIREAKLPAYLAERLAPVAK